MVNRGSLFLNVGTDLNMKSPRRDDTCHVHDSPRLNEEDGASIT